MRERLRAGLVALGISKTDLASALGVSPAIVTRILKGGMPGLKHQRVISEMLKCTEEWLRNGTGPAPSWAVPRDAPPPWATQLLAAVQALRAEVAALRGFAPPDEAADEIGRTFNPDEHPRPKAPTYPRPAAVPGEPPHGR